MLVVLLGAALTWAVMKVQSSPGTAAPRPSATAPLTPSSLTPETAATSSADTSSTSHSSTSGEEALATAQRTLSACAATVAAREQLARAAAASARDWATHTGAQRNLDSGMWTVAQARTAWASSKARGPEDLKQFAAAKAAIAAAPAGCRSVIADTTPTSLAARGKACAAREKALVAVASAGSVVNTQWAAHQKMMAAKAHTNEGAYHDRWVTMVVDSAAPLKRYAATAAALDRAPTCAS